MTEVTESGRKINEIVKLTPSQPSSPKMGEKITATPKDEQRSQGEVRWSAVTTILNLDTVRTSVLLKTACSEGFTEKWC